MFATFLVMSYTEFNRSVHVLSCRCGIVHEQTSIQQQNQFRQEPTGRRQDRWRRHAATAISRDRSELVALRRRLAGSPGRALHELLSYSHTEEARERFLVDDELKRVG